MNARHAIHELVDELPEGKLSAARQALESLREQDDPPCVPIDDEPSSPEENADARKGWEEYKRGECEALADVRCELLE